ncbi:MAG: PhoH family protein [Verrucomicrobiota bacterium]
MEAAIYSQTLEFESPRILSQLYCGEEKHLTLAEEALGVSLIARDDWLKIEGTESEVAAAREFFDILRLARGQGLKIRNNDFTKMLEAVQNGEAQDMRDLFENPLIVKLKRKSIVPKTVHQKQYLQKIRQHDVSFGIGPAGTGKTYLAMAAALDTFQKGETEKLVFTRPAVEAGEALGFLPGDLQEKILPYLRPLYDALYDMVGVEETQRMMERQQIEIAPLAYMRGRTLSRSFVILDEAQNTTPEQMMMFLTRLGDDSKMVITGDITQVDLPRSKKSGLKQAIQILSRVKGVSIFEFDGVDVVRHPLVQRIIQAYEKDSGETPAVSFV